MNPEHQQLNQRLAQPGIQPTLSIADRQGLGLLAHAQFTAAEGDYLASPYLMLTLCTAQTGRMRRTGDGPALDGVLRPGTVAIALPNTHASGFWPTAQMLGIAINLPQLQSLTEIDYGPLVAAASRLHKDSLLTSLMTALWRDAELHGLSSAFFEQGMLVLLRRLAQQGRMRPEPLRSAPLKGPRLQQVLDLMESRLEDDIRVTELAALIGQDVRSFSRAFAAATGLAPYAYFTLRRMEQAKSLLLDAQLSITEIALRSGYANPSKFAAAFRRVCGLSPTAWRQQRP